MIFSDSYSLYIPSFKFQHLNLLCIVQKRSKISISLGISYVITICLHSYIYTIMKTQRLERTTNVIPFLNWVFSHRLGPFTPHRWAEDGLTESSDSLTEHVILIPKYEKRDFHVVNRLCFEFPSIVVLK